MTETRDAEVRWTVIAPDGPASEGDVKPEGLSN